MYIRGISKPDHSTPEKNLEVARYSLLRVDHTCNSDRSGGYVYYQSSLVLRLIDVHYQQKSLICQILFGGELYNFISLHRSPSQSSDSFCLVPTASVTFIVLYNKIWSPNVRHQSIPTTCKHSILNSSSSTKRFY